MPAEPGPFGWVSNLMRWSSADTIVRGQGGPLPPPKSRQFDPTEHNLYQGLADGWLHGTVGAALSSFFSEPRTRKELYVLFEKMDMTDVAGSVLDLYAEDATQHDPDTGRTIWVEGTDPIVQACEEMFVRLQTEEEIVALTRDIGKFGDDFERLVYRSGPDGGIRRMLSVPPINVTRKEDKEARLLGYVQVGKRFRNDNSDTSYPWDFCHFRMRGKDRRYPYGTSILHNAIRPWKQLIILEDWMLGYQVNKHPDRNLVLLDIGTASDVEATDVSRRFRQKLRRTMIIDPGGTTQRGYMGQTYDAHTPLEDMVLPMRPDSQTRIEKLSGSANAVDIAPIHLVLDKFYAAVRVPKAFFGIDFTSGMPVNMKASLVNQDVRYARGVRRVQRAVKAGYRYLCELNLMLLMSPGEGVIQPNDGLVNQLDWRAPDQDFKVQMAPISYLEELERLEVEQMRQQVALAMLELGTNNPAVNIAVWTEYVLREICQVPEELLDEIIQSDMEPEQLDHMRFGTNANQADSMDQMAAKQARASVESARKLHTRGAIDAHLSNGEKDQLAEAIKRSRKLRESISRARRLFDEEDRLPDVSPCPSMLPDRNNELFRTGRLADMLTEADVQEMLSEAVREAGGKQED